MPRKQGASSDVPRDPDDKEVDAGRGREQQRRRRSQDIEMDEVDDLKTKRPARPKQWREDRKAPESTWCARGFLGLVNAGGIIFGSLILYFGVKAFVALKAEQAIDGVQRPFAVVLAGGAGIALFSLGGLLGACCAVSRDHGWTVSCCSNRLLIAYYVSLLLQCAVLFYATLMCFLFVDKAAEYIESYWVFISEISQNQGLDIQQVGSMVRQHSKAAGGLCIGGILLNLLCAHLSAKVMGYRYTSRRTIMIINTVGFVLAIVLLVLAFLPDIKEVGVKDSWLPQLIGALGVFIAVMSLLGLLGAFWNSAAALAVNGGAQAMLALAVVVLGSVCLADAKNSGKMLEPAWGLIKQRFVNVCPDCDLVNTTNTSIQATPRYLTPLLENATDPLGDSMACCGQRASLIVWNNLTVLGVALSTILISMTVNMLSSCYLFRILRRDRMAALDDQEMLSLRSNRRCTSARRAYTDDDGYA